MAKTPKKKMPAPVKVEPNENENPAEDPLTVFIASLDAAVQARCGVSLQAQAQRYRDNGATSMMSAIITSAADAQNQL